MKISFVLGIYNAERTIKECIEAILNQNYNKKDYEIIVVDGGSADNTVKIVKSLMNKNGNIILLNNPHKLSEGKGMGKAQGVAKSKGEIVIFLDHDNIIQGKDWINEIIYPFKDSRIMAVQSMLSYNKNDSIFIKYINAIGIDDPFAIPYSLVSQVTFNPGKFNLIENKYYLYKLNNNEVLYAGANGCAFRKEVFDKVEYSREVDVFTGMAKYGMSVAIAKNARVYHDTSSSFWNYLKKKGKYIYGFFNSGYKYREFNWVKPGIKGKIGFFSNVLFNLTFIVPFIIGLRQFFRTGKAFWILHGFYMFFMTLEYCLIGLFKINNFVRYTKKIDST